MRTEKFTGAGPAVGWSFTATESPDAAGAAKTGAPPAGMALEDSVLADSALAEPALAGPALRAGCG